MDQQDIFKPIKQNTLSDNWGKLINHEFDLRLRDGSWQRQQRETYDRGNGATCLLFNPDSGCVLLTRQFRLPVFLNGGLPSLVETPAGLLDGAAPAERMRAELIEETGYDVSKLHHLSDIYMSPGSVTEYLAFFTGEYRDRDQVSAGGGEQAEGEDIEVLHIPLDEAMGMIASGEIRDAKTIILLQHLKLQQLNGWNPAQT